jgi:5-methylcytosine-specific restriction endonuclease McrA
MGAFDDSLRGYGFKIYLRDNFKCRYCGADGTKLFETWLTLSCDHLLPKGHPNRDNSDYIVTACNFCNTADNHYFEHAAKRGLTFDGKTPDELVAQRLPYVEKVRQQYRAFWEQEVHPLAK